MADGGRWHHLPSTATHFPQSSQMNTPNSQMRTNSNYIDLTSPAADERFCLTNPIISHSPDSSDFEPTPKKPRPQRVILASAMMPIDLTSPVAETERKMPACAGAAVLVREKCANTRIRSKFFSQDNLAQITGDQARVIEFCTTHGLFAASQTCINCFEPMRKYYNSHDDVWYWICTKKKDGKTPCAKVKGTKFTVKKGTWFGDVHVTMSTILWICWYFVAKTSEKNTKMYLDMGKNDRTIVDWFSMCREVCDWWMLNRSEQLGGPGKIVEIDESYFAGVQKYGRGRARKVRHPWGFAAVERGSFKTKMENVEGRGREQLLPILSKWIKPETTIHSDRHGAYFNLEQYVDHCIDHYTVNHKNNYVDPQSGAHTQSVESNWRHCKNSLPDQGLRPYMLQSYLSTFCWHRHVKENNLDPFLFFLECIAELYPPFKTGSVPN